MTENIAQIEAHRTPLTGRCYRMLGSAVEAVQETIIRAWRYPDRFDERARRLNLVQQQRGRLDFA
jgi:RNA polymerase sigma-70 factor (ECF subfamily)